MYKPSRRTKPSSGPAGERQVDWGKEASSALFRVEDKTALSQALSTDEETLRGMLAYASDAGDKDYGKCVLFAADRKGYGEIVAEYCNAVDPASLGLYREYKQVPSEADLERQLENAERIVPAPSAFDVTACAVFPS